MKLAIIGATGFVGAELLKEALSRGHEVTAIVRHPEKVPTLPRVKAVKADVGSPLELAKALAGSDAVISSVKFVETDARKLVQAVKEAQVKRLLVVGGAGSLSVRPGVELVDTPEFPGIYKKEALAGRDFLKTLRQEKELEWTFLSPSAEFFSGERTGKFRLGSDELLVRDGRSQISTSDYAIAMLDEVEKSRHVRQRFTVGY